MFVEKVFAVDLSISFGFVLLHVLGNANVSTHHLKNGNTNKIMRNRESLFGNFWFKHVKKSLTSKQMEPVEKTSTCSLYLFPSTTSGAM